MKLQIKKRCSTIIQRYVKKKFKIQKKNINYETIKISSIDFCWFSYGARGTPHIQQLACIVVMSNTFLHEGSISDDANYEIFYVPAFVNYMTGANYIDCYIHLSRALI